MEETGNWSRLEEAVAENPTVDAIRSEGRAWLGADFPPQILFLARTQLLRAVKSLPDSAMEKRGQITQLHRWDTWQSTLSKPGPRAQEEAYSLVWKERHRG